MPIYDMGCKVCDYTFEVRRSIKESSPVPCPQCGGETRQLFFSLPTMFVRNIDHPDSPLDGLPGSEKMRKQADWVIKKTLKDMGKL